MIKIAIGKVDLATIKQGRKKIKIQRTFDLFHCNAFNGKAP